MDTVASFLLSVLAGVISYYICKWLDEQKKQKMTVGRPPA